MNIRWGIVGPGGIAHKFVEAVQGVEGTTLQAVLSRDMGRARAFAAKYQAPSAYDAMDPFLADADIDAVYIASPHRFHCEQALACLQAGKPVLCEKPLAVNAREAATLIEAARSNRVFLMEAMWTRFLPLYAELRKWTSDEAWGGTQAAHVSLGFPAGHFDPAHRLLNPELAGGAMLDLGIYTVAILQDVFQSDPINIQAVGVHRGQGVDMCAAASLDYGQGRIGQFFCTLTSAPVNKLMIYGPRGHIEVAAPFHGAVKDTRKMGDSLETIERPFRVNGFEYQVEAVLQCLAEGRIEHPLLTHDQMLANMRVIDTVRQQIGTRYDYE